jgi:membrane fusion protein (multidrug efflux system)
MAERDPGFESPTLVKPAGGKRWLRLIVMAAVPLFLAVAAISYYIANDHYVSTDNAYVRQDKVSISAEVSGAITRVAVTENQRVKAGDLLFTIDPRPYRIALAQAEAAMASAQVKVIGLETEYDTKSVDIDSARANLAFNQEKYQRQLALMKQGFTTKAALDLSRHDLSEAQTRLSTAQADATKSRAALATGAALPGENPAIAAARVQREKALFDLSRTEVRAPVSGIVSQSTRLQPGQMMVSGLPAVSIVASDRSWIEANVKETELDHMKIGQSVAIHFDAYPDLKAKGRVIGIGAGTGSEFSVLPAQNATGNWVKVTQRIPVRIAIDGKMPRTLIAGMSAEVSIDTASHGRQ